MGHDERQSRYGEVVIFRQLFDPASFTYTYLVADERSREAVIVDPVFEQHTRDVALVRELGLELRFTLGHHDLRGSLGDRRRVAGRPS
jgi:hypothetical protein